MSYKLVKDDNEIVNIIQRVEDGAFIPMIEANTDYQEYLEWTKLSPANVAAPADE